MNVFIIINEWTDIAGNTSSEVVGVKYFTSENDAWDALALVAEARGTELHPNETSFVREDDPRLQFEEYYIQELMRG